MESAKGYGVVVYYALNYRASLWKSIGGPKKAQAVKAELARLGDVVFGNEEDFSVALGFGVKGVDENFSVLDSRAFKEMIGEVVKKYPNLKIIASTLRAVHSASRNDWGAIGYWGGNFYEDKHRRGPHGLD